MSVEFRVQGRHWVSTEWPGGLDFVGKTVIRQIYCLEPRHQPPEQSGGPDVQV